MPGKWATAPSSCLSVQSFACRFSRGSGGRNPSLWGAGRSWVTSGFWEDVGQSYTEMGRRRALLLKENQLVGGAGSQPAPVGSRTAAWRVLAEGEGPQRERAILGVPLGFGTFPSVPGPRAPRGGLEGVKRPPFISPLFKTKAVLVFP